MNSIAPKIFKALEKLGQQHLAEYTSSLPPSAYQTLLQSLHTIDLKLLKSQIQQIQHPPVASSADLSPLDTYTVRGDHEQIKIGEERIASGKVLCLVLAGGQGSRLGFDGPKGSYPITAIKKKSLFQLLSEKVIAASMRYGRKLPLAIMTSFENHGETTAFFKKNQYFGLNPDQVSFFQQGSLPLLDAKGKLFLNRADSIAFGPYGNGLAPLEWLESQSDRPTAIENIEDLNVIPIDNPLADPYDANLIGFHYQQQNCITIKASHKASPEEKVGTLALREGRPKVVEYTEIPGSLKNYPIASLSLFCFSVNFLKKASLHLPQKLPLHLAWKKVPYFDEKQDKVICPETPNAWKFEYFIFDLLDLVQRSSVLVYPREECFSPLKNAKGPSSPETVQRDLSKRDLQIFTALTGNQTLEFPFELSPKFYYPTCELLKKWQGVNASRLSGYIEP